MSDWSILVSVSLVLVSVSLVLVMASLVLVMARQVNTGPDRYRRVWLGLVLEIGACMAGIHLYGFNQ